MSRVARESLAARVSRLELRGKRVFFKMSLREKGLALLFAIALVFIWLSWQLERHALLGQEHDALRLTEQTQDLELGDGERVRREYAERMAAIDLSALPNVEDVRAQVDALLRRAGFASFDLGEARTRVGADLKFHTFQLNVDNVSYSGIKRFTETIKTELPYLSLESIVIAAQARNNDLVDVRYVFKSIEYAK